MTKNDQPLAIILTSCTLICLLGTAPNPHTLSQNWHKLFVSYWENPRVISMSDCCHENLYDLRVWLWKKQILLKMIQTYSGWKVTVIEVKSCFWRIRFNLKYSILYNSNSLQLSEIIFFQTDRFTVISSHSSISTLINLKLFTLKSLKHFYAYILDFSYVVTLHKNSCFGNFKSSTPVGHQANTSDKYIGKDQKTTFWFFLFVVALLRDRNRDTSEELS